MFLYKSAVLDVANATFIDLTRIFCCRKVEQVAEEAESLKQSLDKYLLRNQRRMNEARERAELLGRAVRYCFLFSSLRNGDFLFHFLNKLFSLCLFGRMVSRLML